LRPELAVCHGLLVLSRGALRHRIRKSRHDQVKFLRRLAGAPARHSARPALRSGHATPVRNPARRTPPSLRPDGATLDAQWADSATEHSRRPVASPRRRGTPFGFRCRAPRFPRYARAQSCWDQFSAFQVSALSSRQPAPGQSASAPAAAPLAGIAAPSTNALPAATPHAPPTSVRSSLFVSWLVLCSPRSICPPRPFVTVHPLFTRPLRHAS
jgi:hypothetical protein